MKIIYGTHILNDMAKVGNYDDFEIIVFSNEGGNIPHFHIRDVNTNGSNFHTCVRLDKPEYFHHTGKEDILNSKQKKELVRFLESNSKVKRFSTFTNWEVLLTLWNMNNSTVELDEDMSMPNYLDL